MHFIKNKQNLLCVVCVCLWPQVLQCKMLLLLRNAAEWAGGITYMPALVEESLYPTNRKNCKKSNAKILSILFYSTWCEDWSSSPSEGMESMFFVPGPIKMGTDNTYTESASFWCTDNMFTEFALFWSTDDMYTEFAAWRQINVKSRHVATGQTMREECCPAPPLGGGGGGATNIHSGAA